MNKGLGRGSRKRPRSLLVRKRTSRVYPNHKLLWGPYEMTVENIDIIKELVKKELDAITKMLNEYPLPLSLAMLLNRYAILYMSKLMGPERPKARPDLLKNS